MPAAGLHGIFQMSFFEHVTILHGVGVGGGSLSSTRTRCPCRRTASSKLPPSWAHLADWRAELEPHYATSAANARGDAEPQREPWATASSRRSPRRSGSEGDHHPTDVAVYFGKSGQTVRDPHFGGQGSDRTRVHALRRLHDRMPRGGQEHARPQLSLSGREARRRSSARDRSHRHSRRRRRRLRRRDQGHLRG